MLPILNLMAIDDPMRQSLDLLANPNRWMRIPLACPRVSIDPLEDTAATVLKTFHGILLGREERVVRRSMGSQQRRAGNIGPLMSVPMFWMRSGEAPEDVYWFNMSSDAYDDLWIATPGHKPDEFHWFEPEHLPEKEEDDARLGRDKFYVYVLGTDRGHYVGHTYDVDRRVRRHQEGECAVNRWPQPDVTVAFRRPLSHSPGSGTPRGHSENMAEPPTGAVPRPSRIRSLAVHVSWPFYGMGLHSVGLVRPPCFHRHAPGAGNMRAGHKAGIRKR